MVKITIVNNTSRQTAIVDENTTIKQALVDAGVNYGMGVTYVDGAPLSVGEINMTFADLGISEECLISSIVKADNA